MFIIPCPHEVINGVTWDPEKNGIVFMGSWGPFFNLEISGVIYITLFFSLLYQGPPGTTMATHNLHF